MNWLLTAIHITLSYDLNAKPRKHLLDKKGVWRKSTKVSNRLDVVEKRKDLNSFFAEAVDDTLKQIFKEDGAKLMVSAAHVIEQVILKNLYRRLGLEFVEKSGYEFPDYIRELREE
jgi:phage gp46-like protein